MAKNSPYDSILVELFKLAKEYSPNASRNIDEDTRKKDIDSIKKRDDLYISHIRNYVVNYNKRAKGQTKMKWVFFVVIMALLFGLVSGTIVAILIISCKKDISLNDFTVVGTSMAGVISAFIILPKVIAKNLFPTTEDDRSAEIFQSVIANDMELRKFHRKTNENKLKENSNKEQNGFSEVKEL